MQFGQCDCSLDSVIAVEKGCGSSKAKRKKSTDSAAHGGSSGGLVNERRRGGGSGADGPGGDQRGDVQRGNNLCGGDQRGGYQGGAEPAATTLILQEASLGSGGVTGVVVEAAREEDSPGGEDLCRAGEAADMGEAGKVLPGADKLQTTPPTKRRKAIDPLSLTPCF